MNTLPNSGIQANILFFISFWLCWGFIAVKALLWLQRLRATLVAEHRLRWFFLFWSPNSNSSPNSRLTSFSSFRTQGQLPGSTAQAQQLWGGRVVVMVHGLNCFKTCGIFWDLGSSGIRDLTHVSCIGRWILSIREAQVDIFTPLNLYYFLNLESLVKQIHVFLLRLFWWLRW